MWRRRQITVAQQAPTKRVHITTTKHMNNTTVHGCESTTQQHRICTTRNEKASNLTCTSSRFMSPNRRRYDDGGTSEVLPRPDSANMATSMCVVQETHQFTNRLSRPHACACEREVPAEKREERERERGAAGAQGGWSGGVHGIPDPVLEGNKQAD